MAYKKTESYDEPTTRDLASAYKDVLRLIGEDAGREGLLRTPERVAKAMQFLTQGQGHDPVEVIREAIFAEKVQEMVIVKDVEMYSLCEHHMIPFFGKAHVAYIPNGYITEIGRAHV